MEQQQHKMARVKNNDDDGNSFTFFFQFENKELDLLFGPSKNCVFNESNQKMKMPIIKRKTAVA